MQALIAIPPDQSPDLTHSRVAGLPLLERLLLALREKGVERVQLLCPRTPDAYRRGLRPAGALGLDLDWHGPDTPLAELLDQLERGPGPTVMLASDVVFEHGLLGALLGAPSGRPSALVVDRPAGRLDGLSLVRGVTSAGSRADGLVDVGRTARITAGLFLVPEPGHLLTLVEPDAAGDASLAEQVIGRLQAGLAESAERGRLELLPATAGFWAPLRDRTDVAPAERGLFNTLRKSTDGFISRNLNRPLSLAMSKVLIRLPIHPNVLTLFSLLVGLASAWFAAQGGYWPVAVGAALLQFNSILDGCDGEIARLRYQTSKLGSLLDTIVDNVSTTGFIVGVVIGLWRGHGGWLVPAAAGLFLALIAVAFALMLFFLLRYGQTASLIAFFRPLVQSIERSRSWAGSVGRVMAKVLKRDSHVFILFLVGLAGQAWLILALADFAALVLTSVILYLVIGRRRWLIAALAADSGNYGVAEGDLVRG